MEAIIQSNNQAINIDINVSINVDVFKANIQRGLRTIKQRFGVGMLTLPHLYRKELRMARAMARAIESHPTLSNVCLWLMGIGIMVEILLFA